MRPNPTSSDNATSTATPFWQRVMQLIAVLFMVFIIFESLRPSSNVETLSNADKFLHVLAYGVLVMLIALAWPRIKMRYVFLIAIIGGALLELAQGAMGLGRVVSMGDIVANIIGALIGAGLIHIFKRKGL